MITVKTEVRDTEMDMKVVISVGGAERYGRNGGSQNDTHGKRQRFASIQKLLDVSKSAAEGAVMEMTGGKVKP